jgi:hypothetical protein
MPKVTNSPVHSPRLSNPEIEAKGKAAEAARTKGAATTDEKIRNQFVPGTVNPRTLEQLNPSGGTPTPSRVADLYATNAPSNLQYLDPQHGFLPAKMPTDADLKGAAKVSFGRDGGPSAMDIRAGGKLVVEYDVDRSPVKENLGSVPAWGVTAFIEFQPSGKRVEAPAVGFETWGGGHVSSVPHSVPVVVDVPAGTTGVSMWFRQFKGADHPGEGWDSNYGKNYQFDVKS